MRDPNYWGRDLPVRRGLYNFDRVTYRIYLDETSRFEGLKAGEFDFMREFISRNWARQYTGRAFESGELAKGEFQFVAVPELHDNDLVALAPEHAHGLEHVGQFADFAVDVSIRKVAHRAIFAFPDEGQLVAPPRLEVAVDGVVYDVDFAVSEPLVKRFRAVV